MFSKSIVSFGEENAIARRLPLLIKPAGTNKALRLSIPQFALSVAVGFLNQLGTSKKERTDINFWVFVTVVASLSVGSDLQIRIAETSTPSLFSPFRQKSIM